MAISVKWLLCAALLTSCSQGVLPAEAASVYQIQSRDAFFQLLPKLAEGDTIDLGDTQMGSLFLRLNKTNSQQSIEKLAGVTVKGGRFQDIRLDDARDVVFDGGRVVMPVTATTARHNAAMLFYRPTNVTIRNYDIQSTKSEGFRLGYGIRLDMRGGGRNVLVEDTLIHELSSGVVAAAPQKLTLRNVTVKHIGGDGFFISAGNDILLDSLSCDTFAGTDQKIVHSDCIQIDKIAGPTSNLVIRDLKVNQHGEFAQWIFGPAATTGGRHSNWTITGTRGVGNTWRALTAHGVDGLHVEDNIMLTPSPPSRSVRGAFYATMMDIAESSDVVLLNNTACKHLRSKNHNIRESRTKTASCR